MADVLAAVQRLSDERLKSKCEMAIDIIDRSIAMYGYVARRVAYAMRWCAHRGWVGGALLCLSGVAVVSYCMLFELILVHYSPAHACRLS